MATTYNLSPEALEYQKHLAELRATGQKSPELSVPGLLYSPDYVDQFGNQVAVYDPNYYNQSPGGLGAAAAPPKLITKAGEAYSLSTQGAQAAYNTEVAKTPVAPTTQPTIQPQVAPTTVAAQPIQPVSGANLPESTIPPQIATLPNLQPGSQGNDVLTLQNYLVSQGYLTQDELNTGPGIYGPKTTAAVAKMQQQLGIDPQGNPGFFGPLTKTALQGGQGGGQIAELQKQVQELQGKADTIKNAEGQGLTPGSTYQQAVDFLASKNIKIDPSKATTNPVGSWQKTYQDLFVQLGLDKVKDNINSNIAEISKLDNELIDKIAEVNDNPWLSEGVRVGRIQKLQDKYEQKKGVLANTLRLYQDTYNSGREEAQFMVSTALQQYNADRNFDLNEQKFLADQAEAAAEARANLGKIDPSRFKEVQGGLYDVQTGEFVVAPKTGMSDLTIAQIQSTLNQITGQFDNEPIVKNYNIISEGYDFAKSLVNKGTSTASDDQGLIYAFAKAMDPNSVVREGEYATVQKYAQSWAETYGFNAARIFSNAPFLTKEARENMVNTIGLKFQSTEKNYDNVRGEYQRRIDEVKTGQLSGSLTDYSGAFTDTEETLDDLDFTITQNQTSFNTRELLIEAIVNVSGFDRQTVADRVYSLIPDKK